MIASSSSKRDVGVNDLDRLHSHRLGGLEIDAEIIEEDTLARLHIEALARDLVETPLGFRTPTTLDSTISSNRSWISASDAITIDPGIGHHRLGT